MGQTAALAFGLTVACFRAAVQADFIPASTRFRLA